MAKVSDEMRELRDRLEAAQSELKRSQQQLLASQSECVSLREELEFTQWARSEGTHSELKKALKEARDECAQLKRLLGARTTPLPQKAASKRKKSRVCLIALEHTGNSGSFPSYVGFIVDPQGKTRDIVRTSNIDEAKTAASEMAKALGATLEDFT